MHINRLFIDGYKNIVNQPLEFPQEDNVTFIGLNGSGKSNYMEALSIIFGSYYKNNKKGIGFNFKLNYILSNGKIVELSNDKDKVDGKEVKVLPDVCLPQNVIACYSGESERLWQMAYKDSFETFFNKAVGNTYEEPKMLYVNKDEWTLSLIALMCSNDPEVKDFLKFHFGIEDLSTVILNIKFEEKNFGAYKQTEVRDFLSHLKASDKYMSAVSTMEIGNGLDFGTKDYCRHIFFYLYLASMPRRNEVNHIDAAISDLDIEINRISYRNISEGEKKLLLIECITKILGGWDSVLILDEPDAHVHVANKKQICKLCKSFPGQTVMSTHSPYVINSVDFDSLRYVENGEIKSIENIQKLTSQISDGSFDILAGTMLMTTKKLIVTEGPSDINYIRHAAKELAADYERYNKIIDNISFVFQGSANQTEYFFETAVKPVMNILDKVLFIFDADAEKQKSGQKGYEKVMELKKVYGNRIEATYYAESYPIADSNDPTPCYIENLFPLDKRLSEALRRSHNPMTFSEIKEANTLIKPMKESLKNGYKDYNKEDLQKFKPLLDEILRVFYL